MERFGPRGTAMWAELGLTRDLSGGSYTLAVEACRIADRLDRLNSVLVGEDFLYVEANETGQMILQVDRALSEARQQAVVLRSLVSSLAVKGTDDSDGGTDFLDDGPSLPAPIRNAKRSRPGNPRP